MLTLSVCVRAVSLCGTNLFKLIFNIGTLLLARSCVGAHALQTMCIGHQPYMGLTHNSKEEEEEEDLVSHLTVVSFPIGVSNHRFSTYPALRDPGTFL